MSSFFASKPDDAHASVAPAPRFPARESKNDLPALSRHLAWTTALPDLRHSGFAQ
jgi:hypothetical protein